MIDTVKIAIYKDFNKSIYEALLHNSENKQGGFMINSRTGIVEKTELWRMITREYDQHEIMMITGKMYVPSNEYHILYRCWEDRIELEFSLPKFIYGTNVLELRKHIGRSISSPYEMLVKGLKKFFEFFFFGHKVNYCGVQIMRWDLCFNQVFQSKTEALRVLEYIKIKYQKKKDTKNYTTGFVELTQSKYQKIYHKGTEFAVKDAVKIGKYKDQFQAMADKILRYEKKITPKNIAYWYNVNIRHQDQKHIPGSDYQKYLSMKNKNKKLPKWLRNEFEGIPRFVLATPKDKISIQGEKIKISRLPGFVKLDKTTFDRLYSIFREEIKKRYTIGKMSVDRLNHELINEENTSYKRQKIKILAFIKVFGSLEKAHSKGIFSDSTLSRYKKIMSDQNLSTTKISNDIIQDFTHHRYFTEIIRQSINVNNLTKDLNF